MSNINIGLIIQGPVISSGRKNDTPNYIDSFDSIDYIESNIRKFEPFVEKIVISTWENSGLKGRFLKDKKIILLENRLPCDKDIDNRRKQFVTIYEGTKYFLNNTKITHVFKIRTDQLVHVDIIPWILKQYESGNFKAHENGLKQENYLFFSDMISNESFYAGDFIIGGTLSDVISFCSSVLSYGSADLHPVIGVDYILKYLKKNDAKFNEQIIKYLPLIWQTSNPKNSQLHKYWESLVMNYFIVIPQSLFSTIIWRGRPMNQVFPNYKEQFFLYEDWSYKYAKQNLSISVGEGTSFFNLIPNRIGFKKVLTAYRRYYLTQRFQYYWKQLFK